MNACACGLTLIEILPSMSAPRAAGPVRSACAERQDCLRERTAQRWEVRSQVGSLIVALSGMTALVGGLFAAM